MPDAPQGLPAPALRASVVVIGDELLSGYVRDENSWFLIEQLRDADVPLDDVHMVADRAQDIAAAVRAALARSRPRLVLTSGGVGPTPDDITIAVVADVLDRPLVTHPQARDNVEAALSWTREQGMDVPGDQAEQMRRMADLPRGATLLAGGPGLTPGIAVDVDGGCGDDGATVVVLPGVPKDLRRIVADGVVPLLSGRGRTTHRVEIRHEYPESFLSPLLREVDARHPDVAIGSYPGWPCLVRLTGPATTVERAATEVRTHLAQLDADAGSASVRARWRARWEDDDRAPADA